MYYGDIIFLNELFQLNESNNCIDKSYRITGNMIYVDFHLKHCIIQDRNYNLLIDCQLIDMNLCRLNGLYQFIGIMKYHTNQEETQYSNINTIPNIMMNASIIRSVDDLDLNLFKQAISIRRRFIHDTTSS